MPATKKDMTIKTTQLLNVIYSKLMNEKLHTKNLYISGEEIPLTFDSREDSFYTTVIQVGEKSLLKIVLGGYGIINFINLPKSFDSKEKVELYFDDIIKTFYASNFHELGHVIFTDMFNQSITTYPKTEYRGFLHQLFNIVEDPKIEIEIDHLGHAILPKDVRPSVYFNFLKEKVFGPQAEEYKFVEGDVNNFINYLLLSLRCGKKRIKETNPIWDKYSSELNPRIIDIIKDDDGTSRIQKTIKLGEWMIENIKELDWSMLKEPPEEERPTGKRPVTPGTPVPTPKKGKHGKETKIEPGDTPKAPDPEKEDGKEGEDEKPLEGMEDIKNDIEDVFNDIFSHPDFHEWSIAKDDFGASPEATELVNELIGETDDLTKDIIKFFKLFKDRNSPREYTGFDSGKLDVHRAMQNKMGHKCDLKVFKHKITGALGNDLCVSLVCDNSGSMCGTKSEICSTAALALAEACEEVGIPFECNAFTKTNDSDDGTCVTIKIKDFKDSFEQAKPYFLINDSSHIEKLVPYKYIPTFYGNSEEHNLYHIWKNLEKAPNKTKLMLVLCDGGTTGSRPDLKKVVNMIKDDGIHIIGIGICSKDVEGMYPECKVFNNINELQDLSSYLIETLDRFA